MFAEARPAWSVKQAMRPPGEYSVVAWHERVRPARRKVRLEAGRTTVMDFDIPLTEPEGHE